MKMKLPMRFRILQLVCGAGEQYKIIDTDEIIKAIFSEYANEKQCNNKTINTHIIALKSVGLIEEIEAYKNDDNIISKYRATEEGNKRLKLIPKYAR